jgi:hypothetical protein
MIAPERFEPITGLVIANAREAQLLGFRRLARLPPAVMLPVFHNTGEDGGVLLYQSVDDRLHISTFIGDPDLRLEHLVPLSIGTEQPMTAHVGGIAIRAYELTSGNVLVGIATEFKAMLQQLLRND